MQHSPQLKALGPWFLRFLVPWVLGSLGSRFPDPVFIVSLLCILLADRLFNRFCEGNLLVYQVESIQMYTMPHSFWITMNSDGNVAVYAGMHSLKPVVKMKREALDRRVQNSYTPFPWYTSVHDQLAVWMVDTKLLKVTRYGSGCGQQFRWTNSRWLNMLGYSCKTWKMSREVWHKLTQQETMSDLNRAVVCSWSKLI